MLRTVALCVEYDGSAFAGSQLQPARRSVQGALEDAWARLHAAHERVILAGRTDAGVHAAAHTAHVKTTSTRDLDTLVRALNHLTPKDVAIHQAWDLPADFHARFSARLRRYRYVILNSPIPSPALRSLVLHEPRPLNVDAMQSALAHLVGEHDFAAFAGAGQEGSTIRRCTTARIEPLSLLGVDCWSIVLEANAFLRHMIRNVVGSLLEVGTGRWSPATLAEILASGDRRNAGPTAQPQGLCLEWIAYDPAFAPLAASSRWDGLSFWRTYQAEV